MAGGRGAPLHAASGGWNQASLGTWPHKHPLILQRGSGPQPWQPRAVSSATRAGHPGDAGPGKRMGRPQTHWGASLATLRAFVPLVGPGGFPHSRAGDRGICITAAGWLPVPACGVDAARDSSGGRGKGGSETQVLPPGPGGNGNGDPLGGRHLGHFALELRPGFTS